MLAAGDTPADAAATDGLIKATTTQTFMADVVQASVATPVLVDFWAPWCGPCRQLTPVLEKVVKAAAGKVRLVTMNIDEHPQIAGQLGIQSIPAVIAFRRGQPIDGFMGALPESQVQAFVERMIGEELPDEASDLIAEAEGALEAGDAAGAAELFAELLVEEPDNVAAIAGLARARIAAGDLASAKETLASAPEGANDPALAAARAQIELAERAAAVGDLAPLEVKVSADPADHQSRFDLAVGLAAAGLRKDALDHLLEIVRRDRAWNEDGARKELVKLFEAWGPKDEHTIAGRKRLSSLLFA
ncbi:thioredoxin [Chelatococcus sambhunathii]|uniref:Thioredoxin n=1 Tax=Chelatococcus sambhunathii TaxID=363953 RepID=A0ABU1DCE9_9HYPH|nr:thioredoxin [Chelatococcus sambhunathii]MDR4305713.1 thioredoxin [Chelatococcus sambhunathii]